MKYLLLLCCLCLAASPAVNAENPVALFAKSPAALAACGPQAVKVNYKTIPTPKVASGPAPGKALVYFFIYAPQGSPTLRFGIDGKWAGTTRGTSFAAVNVDPGRHHVCSSERVPFVGTMVALDALNAQAGKTYFFTVEVLNDWSGGGEFLLNRTDPAEAALLLQRAAQQAPVLAVHPHRRFVSPLSSPQYAIKSKPAIDACGPSTTKFSVTLNPTRAMPATPAPGHALVYFLFHSHTDTDLLAPRGPVVNVGLDGSWSGALQRSRSYLPVEVSPGRHTVCFEHLSRSFGNFVEVRSLDAQAGQTYYFHALMQGAMDFNGDAGPDAFVVTPVDSAEGSLFVETSPLSVPLRKQKRK
ncbi:MAG: hypothetical protein ACYCOR_08495 [Acidobacteriaceae bacterium]